MSEIVLIAEVLPRGVAFRLRRRGEGFVVRWHYQNKPFEVEGATIEIVVSEAIRAASAQQAGGII